MNRISRIIKINELLENDPLDGLEEAVILFRKLTKDVIVVHKTNGDIEFLKKGKFLMEYIYDSNTFHCYIDGFSDKFSVLGMSSWDAYFLCEKMVRIDFKINIAWKEINPEDYKK